MNPYDDETKYRAQILFCIERRPITEISRVTGISESTLYRWKREEGWEEQVQARVMSGPMLAARFIEQMNLIVNTANQEGRSLTNGETDQLAKLGKLADKYDPAARFRAHAMETMDQFGTFLAERDKELREALIPHIVEFMRDVVKNPFA